ncbi:MAG TPA: hypothetical protein VI248_11545 [Kineosporiaceae bacterium]
MHLRRPFAATAVAAAVLSAASTLGGSAAHADPPPAAAAHSQRSCAHTTGDVAACDAVVRTDIVDQFDPPAAGNGTAAPAAQGLPAGYGPSDLRSAYNLTGLGSAATVAVVDAYDDKSAESDLATYRAMYGLAPCTTVNGCFRKVNQSGGASVYPPANGGWAQEISLDLDMVSAICPGCKILLVEANSASLANLGTAVNTAARLGAVAISNSYGTSDLADSTYGSYYNHPGIAITASTGDSGVGAGYPASSAYVTAVGGTSLRRDSSSRGWAETAWSGAGSGCSQYNAALSAAASFTTGCARRAEADVSAVADPYTGVAVYDSVRYQGLSGWLVFGGTSAAAPIIASVYALAGDASSVNYPNSLPYLRYGATTVNDVTSGSNGACFPLVLCTSGASWDGPTGLGTPNGTAAF